VCSLSFWFVLRNGSKRCFLYESVVIFVTARVRIVTATVTFVPELFCPKYRVFAVFYVLLVNNDIYGSTAYYVLMF
jgi:hypothetical protein